MKKKGIAMLAAAVLAGVLLSGCAGNGSPAAGTAAGTTAGTTAAAQEERLAVEDKSRTTQKEQAAQEGQTVQEEQSASEKQETTLKDGIYTVEFDTDSSMFHVSEACDGKGTLTVTDGSMMLHISLPSKNIVNLFLGLAKDAKKDGAKILDPTTDTVTYSDGLTDEVYGFDVPVPVLGEEFDLAIFGKKGQWYDHKATVSQPVKAEETENTHGVSDGMNGAVPTDFGDGEYTVEVTLGGGSGRAGIISPAVMHIKDGKMYARIEWSSSNYD